MSWFFAVAIILAALAFVVGHFVGFFRGYKFGLLHPPDYTIYFYPFAELRWGEWGLRIKLSETKVIQVGSVSMSKEPLLKSSQVEIYRPGCDVAGYPLGWLDALQPAEQGLMPDQPDIPLTIRLAEVIGIAKTNRRGRKSKSVANIQTMLRLVRGWDESNLSSDEYGKLVGYAGSTLENYKKELQDLGLYPS